MFRVEFWKKLSFGSAGITEQDIELKAALKQFAAAAVKNDLSSRLSDGEPLDPVDRLVLANITKTSTEDESPKR